ncbi:MAG TPA: enoyl-CoA hydratase/isomerase family protein [Syntrophomonadaceae bacterium]|nr:enoyl-CoA hydratase/isomerase family protein [Syntrophomonadaceae bacterium]HQE24056.1 enoyl-CoA hydratase/isomerase family protein [Syntrophomonadaceae bacterium]
MSDKVSWDINDHIAIVSFNQVTIDADFIKDFHSKMDEMEKDDEVRVIVIKGAAGNIFFAGYDIGLMLHGENVDPSYLSGKTFEVQQLVNRIEHCPKPVIAVVDGYAAGGGYEMVLACDIVYASDKAMFGTPEVKIGLIPAAGGTIRLPRQAGKHRAMEMILTGRMYTAQQACTMGIVNQVFNQEELLEKALKTAKSIANNAPLAVRAAKASVVRSMTMLDKQYEVITVEENVKCLQSSDIKEGAQAFMENRKPQFKGK